MPNWLSVMRAASHVRGALALVKLVGGGGGRASCSGGFLAMGAQGARLRGMPGVWGARGLRPGPGAAGSAWARPGAARGGAVREPLFGARASPFAFDKVRRRGSKR